MAAILVVKNVAAQHIEWHVTCQRLPSDGFMYTSAHSLYSQMLLCWHPHSEMEVRSGTAFVWDSSCCLQWKCVGMSGRAT
jgi:hypothetical protein